MAERWLAEETDAEGRVRALRAVAYALRQNGEYGRSDALFTEAAKRFIELGLPDEAARARVSHVDALRYLGRYEDAIKLAQENLVYLKSRGDVMQVDAAKQTMNLGLVYWRLGDLSEALTCFRRVRRDARRLGESELDAAASLNLGLVLANLGRYTEALQVGKYAARRCRALGLRERLATVQMNLGLLHVWRGEYARALEVLRASRDLSEELGLDRKRAAVDLDLARAYLALNLVREADEACARAVATLHGLDLPFELAHALMRSGQASERRGELDAARAHVHQAGQLFARLGNAVWEAASEVQAIRLASQREDTDGSAYLEDLVVRGRAAVARLEELGALNDAAMAWLVVGNIEAQLGRTQAALVSYQVAADIGRRLRADHVLHLAYTARGLILETEAPDDALASFGQAIEHLERLRERARADDLKMSLLADQPSLYERVAGGLLRSGTDDRAREAFRWIERGKSRGLLEDLLATSERGAHARAPRVVRTREAVKDLRARLNGAYAERYAVDPAPAARGAATQTDDVGRLEAELAQATRQLQILVRDDRTADVTSLLDVERIQATLPAGVCLLEYVQLGQETLCFVIGRDVWRVERGFGSLTEIGQAAQWLWFQLRKATYGVEFLRANSRVLVPAIDRALQRLGDLLLAPLAEALDAADHVVIVPHGSLHGLPFHALVHRESALLDRVTVSYAPSAAVFVASLDQTWQGFSRPLVLAPDLPDLPWVADEARRLGQLYPEAVVLVGPRATLKALRRHAPRCDALHLATHGVFRADNPAFSGLELADGWLSVGELAELSAGRALVTLSACHTGMSGVGPGDELLGLTRAVLGAGGAALLASLWAANDDTTPDFMAAFYSSVQQGRSRAESLRQATLAIRAVEPHPYFWAPFILVGAL